MSSGHAGRVPASFTPLSIHPPLVSSLPPSLGHKQWEFKQEELGRSFHQATLKVRHKYGAAVDVETSAQWGGSANMRVM